MEANGPKQIRRQEENRVMNVTIYHNPRCSKSRQALHLLEERGLRPTIVEYLKEPPTAQELKQILGKLNLRARDILRAKEAKELGIEPELAEDQLITAMVNNPLVIERPIVVAGDKAALGRPPEKVLELLPSA